LSRALWKCCRFCWRVKRSRNQAQHAGLAFWSRDEGVKCKCKCKGKGKGTGKGKGKGKSKGKSKVKGKGQGKGEGKGRFKGGSDLDVGSLEVLLEVRFPLLQLPRLLTRPGFRNCVQG